MSFKPNFDLLREWKDAEKISDLAGSSPCIAVFKYGKKTLVYVCDRHCANRSFDMVDFCFSQDFGITPDVLLTEIENEDYNHKFSWHGVQDNTLAYAVMVAAKKSIPVVFADLSDEQMVKVIHTKFAEEADLKRVFNAGGPNSDGNLYQQMSAYLDMAGRDRFMLENIATALNKYDTVFAIFGVGHYESQRLVLEDMLGKPEYITRTKNMRGDFSNIKISPIKLCDFKLKK